MVQFKKDTKLATVKRLTTVDDWWYKKSWYAETGKVYQWHLKPLTIKDGVELSNFWKDFQFHTNIGADIRESDELVIDGVSYNVSGVVEADGITFGRLSCIIRKW